MSEPILYVIPVTGPARTETFTGTGIDEIYAALGTDEIDKTLIDATQDWGLYAWVGEHSLNDGSPINRRATQMRDEVRADHGQRPHPNPLCGTAVLMAFDRNSGESIDLPERWSGIAIEAEFSELLEGSTLNSPAAKYIRSLAPKDMAIVRCTCGDSKCEQQWHLLFEDGPEDGEEG
jgi:hypothetical protein